MQHNQFGQRSIERAAESRMTFRHGTRNPALEERATYAIAGFEARDTFADTGHFASAIRERYQVARNGTTEIVAGDHHLVAIVQRGGANTNEDFTRSGPRVR